MKEINHLLNNLNKELVNEYFILYTTLVDKEIDNFDNKEDLKIRINQLLKSLNKMVNNI